MRRHVLAILAGLATFLILELVLGLIARGLWPAYAAAYPTRAYTLPMLWVRLAMGAVLALASGAVTAKLAQNSGRAVLWMGVTLFVLATAHHIQIWPQYPVWYHLTFLAYLVPLAMLGELARRR